MTKKIVNGVEVTVDETTGKEAPLAAKTEDGTEIKVDKTTTQTAVAEETKEVDYEAALAEEKTLREAETEARKKAEAKIVELKRENKGKKAEAPAEGFEVEDDAVDPTAVEKIVEERITGIRKELAEDTLEEELEKISENPKERELIKFHYENTIRTTGITRQSIRRDLARASIIANEPKTSKTVSEMKEALKAKKTAGTGASGANQDNGTVEEVKYSDADLALLKRRGIDPKKVKQDVQI